MSTIKSNKRNGSTASGTATTSTAAATTPPATSVDRSASSLAEFTVDPEQCIKRTRAALDALHEDELIGFFSDPMVTATTIASKAARIRAIEGQIREHAPTFPLELLALLEPAAATLAHYHGSLLGRARPANEAVARLAKATRTREILHASSQFLCTMGLGDAALLDRLRLLPTGYTDTVSAILGYVAMHYDSNGVLLAGAPLSAQQLDEARKEAMELGFHAAGRKDRPEDDATLTDRRKRAYTLAVKTYNRVRSVVAYVRFEQEDADAIAPSLGNRPFSKSSRQEAERADNDPPSEKPSEKPSDKRSDKPASLTPAPIGPANEDPLES